MNAYEFGDAPEGHPSSSALAAYLAAKCNAAERTSLEAHLADCPECRRDIAVAQRALRQTADRETRHRPWWAIGLAAAAVLAAVAIVWSPGPSGSRPGTASRLRGVASGVDGTHQPAIEARSPGDGATVSLGALHFVWSSPAPESSYRLTITDERGDLVKEVSTTDTSLVLSGDARLRPGASYYWYVDALLPDGSSVTTGVHAVTITR